MAVKKCTTVAGTSPCCAAAQRGLLGKVFTFTDSRGNVRCGECNTIQSTSKRHAGALVFQFRFHKSAECGIGPRGCAALLQGGATATGGGGGQGILQGIFGGGGPVLQIPGQGVPQLAR